MSPNHNQGFSLIELLIAVAIVGILAAIAIPSYTGHIERSDIRSAQADLSSLSAAIENDYQRRLTYHDNNLNTEAAFMMAFPSWSPSTDGFAFTYTPMNANTAYLISAVGTIQGINCTLTLNQAGLETSANCTYTTNGEWL